jgi:hypothetical protein
MKNSKSLVEIATSLNAKGFADFLDHEKIFYEILDCDNVFDYNDSYFNILVSNPADGTSIEGENFLFINGSYES